jgi:hypothetical protein
MEYMGNPQKLNCLIFRVYTQRETNAYWVYRQSSFWQLGQGREIVLSPQEKLPTCHTGKSGVVFPRTDGKGMFGEHPFRFGVRGFFVVACGFCLSGFPVGFRQEDSRSPVNDGDVPLAPDVGTLVQDHELLFGFFHELADGLVSIVQDIGIDLSVEVAGYMHFDLRFRVRLGRHYQGEDRSHEFYLLVSQPALQFLQSEGTETFSSHGSFLSVAVAIGSRAYGWLSRDFRSFPRGL